jgi:two-component system sensor histidine kinase KdpD
MKDKRPNPEDLLEVAEEEARQGENGKLRIYLGAAPGVGKTYSMLEDAQAKRNEGLDVVVGVVESHGRKEIDALLSGLEILSRQMIDYRGMKLTEFDLDAALKRNPGLILIDEMAHTNAPGLRHEKRWQDIKELLDRGIDVYTTVNVQHIESRKDDVAKIIHIHIKESVPDLMFEIADTIELVDLPPEDLLKRLEEGKVYFPQQAELAKVHFFRVGNLIALREIALRYTADRVGADVLLYRRGQGIKHIWPTRDKILVCIGPGESNKLIRSAWRIAKSLNAEWVAVYVDVPRLQSSEEERNRAVHKLRLAEKLGAHTRLIVGVDIVKEIISFAREQNITQIMVWKNSHQTWRDYFKIWKNISSGRRVFTFSSLADKIVRNSGEIDVYVMTGEREVSKLPPAVPLKRQFLWESYVAAVAIVGVATLIDYFLFPILNATNLIMIYFFGVFLVAIYDKMLPTIFTAILSVLVCSFLFLPPYYTFAVFDSSYLLSIALMFFIALTINYYTVISRREATRAGHAERQIARLHSLSRQLATTRGVDKLLNIGVEYIAEILECDVQALLPDDVHLVVRAKSPTEWTLDAKELSVAQWVNDLGQMAGLGTDTLPFSKALYIPLLASRGTIGVLSIRPKSAERLLTPEEMHLLESFAHQLAITIEADLHHDQTKKSELLTETDRVRSGLLKSFSHDLQTPLVSIMGSASTLIEVGPDLEKKKIQQLQSNIFIESDQLNRLINNLLQITNLETQVIQLNKELCSLEDIIFHVLGSPGKKILNRDITVNFPANLPKITVDQGLMQEVMHNLIDNAVKFTPPESLIKIFAVVDRDTLIVSIEDQGPGILGDELNSLFEKFYRGKLVTIERGMGLGLTVCRTLIKAHGGEIWAENRKEGGAAFRFSLPLGD